jgi:hypothetical protein
VFVAEWSEFVCFEDVDVCGVFFAVLSSAAINVFLAFAAVSS